MILWTSWFHIKDEEHRNEVLRSIELNLENPHIEKLKLLCEIDFLYEHPKLECIKLTERPTYQTFTDMFDPDQINTIANSDIVFDYDSSTLINQIKPNSAYCITRYQLESDYKLPLSEWKGTYWQKLCGLSQDAWVIYKPTNKIIADLFPGILGCEGRFCYSLYQAGIKLFNKGPSIKTFHVHSSKERNYPFDYLHQNYPAIRVQQEAERKYRWSSTFVTRTIWFTPNIFSEHFPQGKWFALDY